MFVTSHIGPELEEVAVARLVGHPLPGGLKCDVFSAAERTEKRKDYTDAVRLGEEEYVVFSLPGKQESIKVENKGGAFFAQRSPLLSGSAG